MRASTLTSAVSAGMSAISVMLNPSPMPPEAFVEKLARVLDEFRGGEYVAVRVPFRHGLADRLGEREPATVVGMIESVAADADAFVLRTEDETTVTVMVDETTAYTINGAEAKRDEALVVARKATVTHENNVATRVDVVTEGS